MKDSAPTPDQPVWFLEQIRPPHAWLTDGKGDSWWTRDPHKSRTWKTKEDALAYAAKLPKESERCYPTEHIFISVGQTKQAAAITKQEQEDKREEKRLIEMLSSSDGAEGKQPEENEDRKNIEESARRLLFFEKAEGRTFNTMGEEENFFHGLCVALDSMDKFEKLPHEESQSNTVTEEKPKELFHKCGYCGYEETIKI